MNNTLQIATVESFKNNATKDVLGLVTVTSAKTKASSIGLMKKKTFTDAFRKKNPDATNKAAAQAFEQYRVATLRELTNKTAGEMLAGRISVERVRADGSGDLRTLQLVRRDRAAQDRNGESLRRTSELTGIPVETLIAAAKSRNASVDIEIETSEAKPQGNGAAAPQSNAQAPQGEQAPAQTGPDATARENGQASGGRPPQVEEPLTTAREPQAVAAQ